MVPNAPLSSRGHRRDSLPRKAKVGPGRLHHFVRGDDSSQLAAVAQGSRGHASRDRLLSSLSATATESCAGADDPTGPRFFQEYGTTRLDLHHTCIVGFPVRGMVREVFLNSIACNLMASVDGPSDEPPSSEESGQLSAISGQ